MGPAESHFLLQTLYNMEMGLYDHMDPSTTRANPLAVIRAFPEEDTRQSNTMRDLAYRYKKNQINRRYNLNFIEYIQLPVTVARQMDDMADEVMAPIELAEAKARKAAEATAQAEAGL